MREVATCLFVACIIISWIAQQFFGLRVQESIFYSFVSLVCTGCFGYSFERTSNGYDTHNPLSALSTIETPKKVAPDMAADKIPADISK